MPEQRILRVAVPAPLHHCFDYLPPADLSADQLVPGVRVRVPFGRGERCGVLLELVTAEESSGRRLKPAGAVLDTVPLFSAADLALLRWAAGYYQHPIGEVFANALPVRLRRGEPQVSVLQKSWTLTALGRQQDPARLGRARKQAEVLALLQESGGSMDQAQILQVCSRCARRAGLARMSSRRVSSEERTHQRHPGSIRINSRRSMRSNRSALGPICSTG